MDREIRIQTLRTRYAAFCKSAQKCREPGQTYDQFLEHVIISLQEKYEPEPGVPPEPIPPLDPPAGGRRSGGWYG